MVIQLKGKAKFLAYMGNEIIQHFFADSSLDDTLERLNQVLEILHFVQSKENSIASAIEAIQYAKSYAANVKSWKST